MRVDIAGENIAPADVEKALEEHPDISAVAVIGIPDARWGETVGAYVQRTPEKNHALNTKEIRIWLRNRIAAHKIPDHVFWIGEEPDVPQELPVNASGKVLKAQLSATATELLKQRCK